MSSDIQQPEPADCPHCRMALPSGWFSTVCPKCGGELKSAIAGQAGTAPLSPFDDLFDAEGAPSWAKTSHSKTSPLSEQEPPEIPETIDPFATTPELVLEPLEGESKALFDFTSKEGGTGNASVREAEHEDNANRLGSASLKDDAQNDVSREAAAMQAENDSGLAPLPFDEETQSSTSDSEHDAPSNLASNSVTGGSTDDDPDKPLRIEGLESESPAGDLATVRCRICDSLVYVQPSELGGKVKCPECYSEIDAQQAAPRRSSASAFPKQQGDSYVLTIEQGGEKSKSNADDEYRLSDPIERSKVEVPGHYGFEPGERDLLAPLPSRADLTAEGANRGFQSESDSGISSTSRNKPGRQSDSEPIDLEPTEYEPVNVEVETKAVVQVTPNGLLPDRQKRPVPIESIVEESTATSVNISLQELALPGPGLITWVTSMFRDAWFLVCFGLSTLSLGFSYWCSDLVFYWLGTSGEKRLGAIVSAVLLGIPGMLAFFFGIGLTVIFSALLFHLGGRKQPRLSDWKGYNFNDWAPAVGFVSFAFSFAALPGLLLGILLTLLSGSVTALPILVALSVTLLAPLFVLGVCRRDSPFAVFDSKVFKLFSFGDVDWLKYLPGSIAAFLLFLTGTLFLLLNGLFWSTLGAAAQVAGWAVFGSLTGLYSGLMVEKANQNES